MSTSTSLPINLALKRRITTTAERLHMPPSRMLGEALTMLLQKYHQPEDTFTARDIARIKKAHADAEKGIGITGSFKNAAELHKHHESLSYKKS